MTIREQIEAMNDVPKRKLVEWLLEGIDKMDADTTNFSPWV